MRTELRRSTRHGLRARFDSRLLPTLAAVLIGIVPASATDDVNLSVEKGPGADEVALSWTVGHGGPYTVFVSPLPPPEGLPENILGTTPSLTWTASAPIGPGGVRFFRVLAAGCLSGGECLSGFCADGYCCDTACLDLCDACNRSGFEGTCGAIATGQDPNDECVSGEACDGAGACAPCPAEVCNGLDDDCDSVVDDGDPGGGIPCNTGLPGVCVNGTTLCQGGGIVCEQDVAASSEVCDGLDNDCDGAVDNGNPGGGLACNTGQPGVCMAGTTQCESGAVACEPDVPASPEVCDGLDNDCDGAIDQGNPQGGSSCNTGQLGVCAAGTVTCAAGSLLCVRNVEPSPDTPDEGFGDSNCDGIDGDLAKAIFVSNFGSNGNSGTSPAAPVQTIAHGLSLASAAGRNQILLRNGLYNELPIILKNGVGIYGNYIGTYTMRTPILSATEFAAEGPKAVTGADLTDPTDIQFLFVQSANGSVPGESSYGVFATNSPGLRIRYSRIAAGAGSSGEPGNDTSSTANGNDGGLGQAGCENDTTITCDECGRPQGGSGGASPCGRTGGRGGNAGQNGSGGVGGTPGGPSTPGGQGNWNTPQQYWGGEGNDGAPGANGSAGNPVYVGNGYQPSHGGNGNDGSDGNGGGGGGGGGGGTTLCNSYGGAGAGGGGGGCKSSGAGGGTSAGGSFAVYLSASNALIESSELFTSSGGQGGNGGTSGEPGIGGIPGRGDMVGSGAPYGGANEQDDGSNGARGGFGGNGGRGGHGGGGAGGPSVGIVRAGVSDYICNLCTFNVGAGGAGGSSAGNSGPVGVAQDVFP